MNMLRRVAAVSCITNGLNGSVMRIDAICCFVNLSTLCVEFAHTYLRYYRPTEPFNHESYKAHDLDETLIRNGMIGQNGPKYFYEDIDSFVGFLKMAELVIAHNYSFIETVLPLGNCSKSFCTMESNTDLLCIPDKYDRHYKHPSLEEAAKHYNVQYNPKYRSHDLYKVAACMRIYLAMLRHESSREIALSPWLD